MSKNTDHFDERDVKLVKAIMGGVKGLLKPIETNLKNLVDKLNEKVFTLDPFVFAKSPKEITPRGRRFLDEHKVDFYLYDNCELLKDEKRKKELQAKDDVEIFMECRKWVQKEGEKKLFELMYNSNASKEECIEVFALAILEKIKKSTSHK